VIASLAISARSSQLPEHREGADPADELGRPAHAQQVSRQIACRKRS
jgi:hypothetical protein